MTIAKGDAASAVALVTLLVVATVVIAPIVLPLLLPGVQVDPVAIMIALSWQMLLPLAVGVFLHERYPEEAAEYVDEVATISNVALALLFARRPLARTFRVYSACSGAAGSSRRCCSLQSRSGRGYLLGIPAGVERRLLALGTAQRNVAAAFIIAAGSFADRPVVLELPRSSRPRDDDRAVPAGRRVVKARKPAAGARHGVRGGPRRRREAVSDDDQPADPDSRARTHLANERTFLAWFRTGLTLIALGVAASQFLTVTTLTGARLIPLFSTLVIAVGVGFVLVGGWRYRRGQSRIDAGHFAPAGLSVVVTSVAALVAGLLALLLVWLTPRP